MRRLRSLLRVAAISAAVGLGVWALTVILDGSWLAIPAVIGALVCTGFSVWLPPPWGPAGKSARDIVMYMDTMIGYRDRGGPPEDRP